MESATGVGFMAVFAVSGSVVLLALQAHKRLLSDFMKKIESELGSDQRYVQQPNTKKKVRFADDVIEPSSNNKEYRRRHLVKPGKAGQVAAASSSMMEDTMPLNRRVLYKEVVEV